MTKEEAKIFLSDPQEALKDPKKAMQAIKILGSSWGVVPAIPNP
jgi:hypothetical protein